MLNTLAGDENAILVFRNTHLRKTNAITNCCIVHPVYRLELSLACDLQDGALNQELGTECCLLNTSTGDEDSDIVLRNTNTLRNINA